MFSTCGQWRMYRDDITLFRYFIERYIAVAVIALFLLRRVVEKHFHSCCTRPAADKRADVARSDYAKSLVGKSLAGF